MRRLWGILSGLALVAIVSGNCFGGPIQFPAVQVTSLAHSYQYAPGGYGTIKDYFNILGGTGSALTVPYTVDLSTADPTISIGLAAPAGKKFVFAVPTGATSNKLYAWISWTSGLSSSTETLWMPPMTFEGLSGTAPTTPPGVTWTGTVGADYLVVDLYLPGISQSFNFTGLRFDLAVPAGGLSSWSKTYTIQNASILGQASGPGLADQAVLSIVDIAVPPVIPAPGAILLAGAGAGLVGWLRRRRTI